MESTVTRSRAPSTTSTISDMSSGLLDLPAEVRNLIYKFTFSQTTPMHLRCPSQRRLRPSRTCKDDGRGLLDACSTIRAEAITLFYSLNSLVFRSSTDALGFMCDPDIHPLIKTSLTHIAVDFGDTVDSDSILQDHINLVDVCVGDLPHLKALETRFYARTLDACASNNFRTAAMAFDALEVDLQAPPPPRSSRSTPRHSRQNSRQSSVCSSGSSTPVSECSSIFSEPEPIPTPVVDMTAFQADVLEQYCFTPSAAIAFASSNLKFSVAASSDSYPGLKHDKLICYNLRIGVDGVANALGPAKEAVKARISRVGMLPRRLSELYDESMDGGFHQRVLSTLTRIDVGVS